jgi:hypothetical protein
MAMEPPPKGEFDDDPAYVLIEDRHVREPELDGPELETGVAGDDGDA